MPVNHAFLRKVYDVYNNSDFEYGQDNLNPKRELAPSYDEQRILKTVSKRISAIEEVLKDIPLKEKNIDDKIGYPINDYPLYVNNKINNIVVPGVTSYPAGDFPGITDLENQVTKLISLIGAIDPESTDPTNPPELNFPDILKLDCSGLSFENQMGMNEDDGSGDEDDDGEEDGDNLSDDGKKDKGQGGSGQDDSGNDPLKALSDCALLDLWWLKIILIILWIIKILMLIVSLVFAIIIPVSKMIRDACVCWIDPPALNVAITLNCEVIVSIIMTIISILLTILFSLLKFDCITDMTQEIIDAIKSLLTGVLSGVELGCNLVIAGVDLDDQAKKEKETWKAFKKELKAKRKARKEQGLKMNINADTIEQIMDAAQTASNAITESIVGKTFGAADVTKIIDENTETINSTLKSLGVNQSTGDLTEMAYDAAKQLFNMSNSENGLSFDVDDSAFTETLKKIKDNAERFVALCRAPYDKIKKNVKDAQDAVKNR